MVNILSTGIYLVLAPVHFRYAFSVMFVWDILYGRRCPCLISFFVNISICSVISDYSVFPCVGLSKFRFLASFVSNFYPFLLFHL